MKAVLFDNMYMMPLCFLYEEDSAVDEIEDQMMVGESIMIAPIYEQNKSGRYVYVPEDMLMLHFENASCYKKSKVQKGHHYISMPKSEVILFVRKNHLFLLGKGGQYVEEASQGEITIIGWLDKNVAYQHYDDDGITNNCKEENIKVLTVKQEKDWKLEIVGKEEGLLNHKYTLDLIS